MAKRFLGLTPDGRRRYSADYIIPPPAPAGDDGDPAINDQIDQSTDDARMQEVSGFMHLDEAQLQCTSSAVAANRIWAGLRFRSPTGVNSDPDAWPALGDTIDVAYAELYLNNAGVDDANLDIYGEDGASPSTFIANAFDISDRVRTTESVPWVEDDAGAVAWVQTPSLVDIVQELVDDYTITTLVLILKPRTNTNKWLYFRSWDHDTSLGAKLHLEWTEPPPPPQTITPDPFTIPIVVPAPTVVSSLTIAPDPVAIPIIVAEPALTLSLTIAPDPVAIPIVIPEPIVKLMLQIITPDALVIPIVMPVPTIASSLTLAPDAVVVPIVIPAPTLALSLAITPDALAVPVIIPAPLLVFEPIIYQLTVAWHDPPDILTGDIMSVESLHGRGESNRWQSGQLSILLRNDEGKYSPNLHAHLKTGTPLWFAASQDGAAFAGLWAGVVDSIVPSVSGGMHTATIKAIGGLSLLGVVKNLGITAGVTTTGVYAGIILDRLDLDALILTADWDTGQETTGMFYAPSGVSALELIRQMEDCEPGQVYEHPTLHASGALLLGYADRDRRTTAARSLASQATFSDNPALDVLHPIEITQLDPLSNIYNSVQVNLTADPVYVEGAVQLWEVPATLIYVPPANGTVELTARYPNDKYGNPTYAYADAWVTPTVAADGDVWGIPNPTFLAVIDVIKGATEMTFSVQNSHPTDGIFLLWCKARGERFLRVPATVISARDDTSIAAYGTRVYPLSPRWMAGVTEAQEFCDYIVSRHKDPHTRLRLTFVASRDVASLEQALDGRVDDRVTCDFDGASGLGINGDFYIENINHSLDQGKTRHIVTYELLSVSSEA